jgi:uncharacterized SAM-binding protein YcdF (DUF218 family)
VVRGLARRLESRPRRSSHPTDVNDFLWFLCSSGGMACTFLAGGLWLWRRPLSAHPRRFLLAAAVGYTLVSIYGVSYLAGRTLVIGLAPFERWQLPSGRSAVVVLGSGTFTARDWQENRFTIVDRAAASRVLETARVFRLVNPDWVISSGGNPVPDYPSEPSGLTMRDTLVRLGVPAERILVATESKTTHHEATIVAPMLRSLNVEHTILVTSDTHMRRSLGAFKAEGIDAVPAIARHPFTNVPWDQWFVPSEAGLGETRQIVHELAGIVYYGVRGWYRF